MIIKGKKTSNQCRNCILIYQKNDLEWIMCSDHSPSYGDFPSWQFKGSTYIFYKGEYSGYEPIDEIILWYKADKCHKDADVRNGCTSFFEALVEASRLNLIPKKFKSLEAEIRNLISS